MDFFGILFDMKNGKKVPYSKSYFDTLFAAKLEELGVKTITGTLPLTFTAKAGNMVDWNIEGNADGIGERTKNYANVETGTTVEGITFTFDHTNGTITANGTATGISQCRVFFNSPGSSNNSTVPEGNYYYSGCPIGGGNSTYNCYSFDLDTNARSKRWDGSTTIETDNGQGNCQVHINGDRQTITIRITSGYTANNVVFKPMLRSSDTNDVFIPYGYQIPLKISQQGQTDKNYDIFIGDTPLTEGETVSKTSTGIDLELFEGSNTVSTTLYNKPAMEIKYK